MSDTKTLREAAQAVLSRWDSPQWEWLKHGPTADLMHELRAALAAQAQAEPVAVTWYEGAPPFPQDQEWFIAETKYGDRVVLRSLDEGREHKHTYDFKTADGTYMKTEIITRWMQFPDCEYLPPKATKPAAQPLTERTHGIGAKGGE